MIFVFLMVLFLLELVISQLVIKTLFLTLGTIIYVNKEPFSLSKYLQLRVSKTVPNHMLAVSGLI